MVMKISVRNLKRETFIFEVEEDATIDQLKDAIFERLAHEKDWQNLIFSGTMLDSSRTIKSYDITEKDFLVLLVKKPRVVAPKPTPAPVAEPAQTTAPAPTPTPSTPTPATTTTPSTPPVPSTSTPATTPEAQSPFGLKPEEIEATVRGIMELGYERSQVERALQVCYFNGDRAAELLMSGQPIPDPQGPLPVGGSGGSGGSGNVTAPSGSGGGEVSNEARVLFQLLRENPQFNTLRMYARQNPQLLAQLIQQLPPEAINIISQNQDEFARMLAEEPGTGGPEQGSVPPQQQQQQQQQQQPMMPQRQIPVNLTPEEDGIVKSLMEMGFTKQKVLEAYLLFEKDADMTANYLLNHGWDEGQ